MSANSSPGPLVARKPAEALAIAVRVAQERGFRSRPVPVRSLTNAVLSLADDGVMVRIAVPGVPLHRVETEVDVCRKLRRLGVPMVAPLDDRPVMVVGGANVSLWALVPATSTPNWERAGRAARLLHNVDPRELEPHELSRVPDLEAVKRSLSAARAARLLSARDTAILEQYVQRAGEGLGSWNAADGHFGVVQGDLVPNNFVFGPDGPVICDTDYLATAMGPATWDLGFMRVSLDALRAVDPDGARDIASGFVRGYGEPLPSTADAEMVHNTHALAWTVWAVLNRRLSEEREKLARMALGWWPAEEAPDVALG